VALLIIFGFLAGAATALSPCVLPVLPVVLSAGALGGRRRPLGIVVGLTLSFTFATVALVYLISALGLPNSLLRTLAVLVLIGFGITLIVPALSSRVEGWMSRFTGRLRIDQRGTGFGSGMVVGLALGLVYAPCAGPILAGVITTSAAQTLTVGRVAVALAYGAGSGLVLYILMLGGRRLTRKLAAHSGRFQQAMGLLMVVVGIAMIGQYDLRFQTYIAAHLPGGLVNPTGNLEAKVTKGRLTELRGIRLAPTAPDTTADGAKAATTTKSAAGFKSSLPKLGAAPEFTGTGHWFNTAGGKPLTIAGLRGKVVLIDFWTYSCINCIRTLPSLEALDAKYRSKGLVIIGIHSPEFPFEKSTSNVADAIKRDGIKYPVVQDNDLATWTAWGNQYWPANYLIDANGQVRYTHFGEGGESQKESAIRSLLQEAGNAKSALGTDAKVGPQITASNADLTPESYVGSERAQDFVNGAITPGLHNYGALPASLQQDHLAYGGTWQVASLDATAKSAGASLALHYQARRVYLVLGTASGKQGTVTVTVDGKPVTTGAGSDVKNSRVIVNGQRLYTLLDLPKVQKGTLHLQMSPGVQAYAFTFG
jgi:cytochrome c biogenesis protein CcdA/thiol-disulfide isomerase/thioredoxin